MQLVQALNLVLTLGISRDVNEKWLGPRVLALILHGVRQELAMLSPNAEALNQFAHDLRSSLTIAHLQLKRIARGSPGLSASERQELESLCANLDRTLLEAAAELTTFMNAARPATPDQSNDQSH